MALEFVFANNAGSTLAGPINNTTTVLSVASGGGALFPNPTVGTQQFAITLIDAATGLIREICYVSSVSVDTFTVLRGQEGTAAENWLAGDLCQELWTAGQCASLVQTNQVFAISNTYYVNGTTGNDLNPGTNSLPFKTIQGAINSVILLISENAITINVAAGTYAGFQITASQVAGWNIIGSGASTCNVTVTSGATPTAGRGMILYGSQIKITGFTITSLVDGIASRSGASVVCYNCNFVGIASTSSAITAIAASVQVLNATNGTTINIASTISGTFGTIFAVTAGGSIGFGYNDTASSTVCHLTITFGTTTTTATAAASSCGSMNFVTGEVTFAGATPTGPKFIVNTAGGIAGASTLPGSIAGTTTTPGWTA